MSGACICNACLPPGDTTCTLRPDLRSGCNQAGAGDRVSRLFAFGTNVVWSVRVDLTIYLNVVQPPMKDRLLDPPSMSTCSSRLSSTLGSFSPESTRGTVTLDGQRRSGRLSFALPSSHSAVAILAAITCGVVVGSLTSAASSKSALPSAMLPLYVSTLGCSDAMAANSYDRQYRDIPVLLVSAATGCAARGCAYFATSCTTTAANELSSVACSACYQYDSTPTPLVHSRRECSTSNATLAPQVLM